MSASEDKGKRIYGIDLGTTYSCIAGIDQTGTPRILNNAEGDQTTPSVVYYESDSNIVVGMEAKRESSVMPDRVVSFIKRYMGRPDFSVPIGDKNLRPEEVSAAILRSLVEGAAQSGEVVEDVIITCPAYFGNSEREATRKAGELAGLNVRHILNEPTAAAISYGLDKVEGTETILVYDFGGGTFDVTLIRVDQDGVRVLHTDGERELGGKDIDERIAAHLATEFISRNPEGGDPRDDQHGEQDLLIIAEDLKRKLSTKEKATARISHAGAMDHIEVTRETLEELISDLIGRTVDISKRVIAAAGELEAGKIDRVLLVGGSSRIPCVRARIQAELGIEPSLFEPDFAIAKGAALMGLKKMIEVVKGDPDNSEPLTDREVAKKIEGVLGDGAAVDEKIITAARRKSVVNVCSKGFGIAVVVDDDVNHEEVSFIIHSQTAVPCEKTERYGTFAENQTRVLIKVYEQLGETESKSLSNNTLIADGVITGLPEGLSKGAPIDVTFKYREDGTLEVLAREISSGISLEFEAARPGVMTEQEISEARDRLNRMSVNAE